MKVHYIDILLLKLILNILTHNHRNHEIISNIQTTRLLCECDIYTSIYDNDPEMKLVIQQFNNRTAQRFKEYDERVIQNRQKCKEQCNKDIQEIILKDKIEKELKDKISALETNISTEDIPTCVCEKSMANKTEKFCLNCGKNMGAIAPWWSLVCGVGYAGWTHYTATTLVKIATEAGIKKGIEVGLAKVTEIIKNIIFNLTPDQIPPITVGEVMTAGNFSDGVTLHGIVKALHSPMFAKYDDGSTALFSTYVQNFVKNPRLLNQYGTESTAIANAFTQGKVEAESAAASTTSILHTTIIASVVAIVVIVLVMLIIYLILRYRKKNKMKKKLQYIKLLKD
ncbi:rifin PIR protein, putative [Plasmodium sp. gorilla clade G2]|uniref:rifin PIR protein, putative n=1 Tax=Plasmodium sp. gorilla clade G2 TaxID=880535 RepID=UPI000D214061|nr:rifin PIR protein, putative [Plasmodium sp. gorilla clade G2]SOV13505.1 rifin PIR protein, putative [Plasmodium sp. gorilla clade G2]